MGTTNGLSDWHAWQNATIVLFIASSFELDGKCDGHCESMRDGTPSRYAKHDSPARLTAHYSNRTVQLLRTCQRHRRSRVRRRRRRAGGAGHRPQLERVERHDTELLDDANIERQFVFLDRLQLLELGAVWRPQPQVGAAQSAVAIAAASELVLL